MRYQHQKVLVNFFCLKCSKAANQTFKKGSPCQLIGLESGPPRPLPVPPSTRPARAPSAGSPAVPSELSGVALRPLFSPLSPPLFATHTHTHTHTHSHTHAHT